MRVAAGTAVFLLFAFPLPAQIVSPAGTMDVMVAVQHTHIYAHTNGSGTITRNIDVRSVSATLGVEYSVTDRFALGLSVPYVRSRYRGPAPHPGVIVDDGSFHGSMQDLQFDARYALVRGDVVVSPFAGFRYPARDYETMGHAAAGRGLRELEIGVAAGHQFIALPSIVAAGSVSHTFSQAVEDIRVNRTNADLQLGYAVTSRLFVRAFGAWQRSHGGLDIPVPPTSEHFHHHDQVARTNYTRAGAGAVVSLTEPLSLHLNYATVHKSVNAHMGSSVSVGLSWSVAPRERVRREWSRQAGE